jgi:predicted esterase YcpF (UPF0227 family)
MKTAIMNLTPVGADAMMVNRSLIVGWLLGGYWRRRGSDNFQVKSRDLSEV